LSGGFQGTSSVASLDDGLTFEKAASKDPKQASPEARQYRLAMLRESASDVTEFISSLSETQLHDFWMPCKLSLSALVKPTPY
jgi:hypothetical protein